MKIGIVTTWFERGAAYVSKQFYSSLSGEHDVFIYARGGESYAKNDPNWDHDYVTWGAQPNSHAPTDIALNDFTDWLDDNNLDLVLFNEQHVWEPVISCKKKGIKTGAYIDYYTEKTVPYFACYDFLICNTKKHLSAFDWHSQAKYIRWGTDTSLYSPKTTNRLSKEQVFFFHSSGMSPYRKGTDLLLRAFEKLPKEAKLIIHTQVDLINSLPELKSLILNLKEADRLEVVEGSVTAPGLFYKGDVYVYPTRLEGIGLTIAEASASGLPSIVPDNGPMNEFIEEGYNGKLVQVKKYWSRSDGYYWPQCEVDIPELALKMKYFLENSDKISEYKTRSRLRAEKLFDWNVNALELGDFIHSVRPSHIDDIQEIINSAEHYDDYVRARNKKAMSTKIIELLKQRMPRAVHLLKTLTPRK